MDRGRSVASSILVRSTTASMVAPPLASTAIACPVVGLLYAVTVCGSKPLLKPFPIAQVNQSLIAGVRPPPDTAGREIAVRVLPPNSPVTTPKCVPCATARPLAPAARNDSDRL